MTSPASPHDSSGKFTTQNWSHPANCRLALTQKDEARRTLRPPKAQLSGRL